MYVNGLGVPKDAAEGMTWIRKAVEQGDAYAQLSLGLYYWSGLRGGSRVRVPPDFAKAGKWYCKAAEQGYVTAQSNLGIAYDNGLGVPEDGVAAYAWYSVAAASGDDGGRENRDDIKRKLTPSQIDRGQVMAREIFERIEKRKAAEAE